MPTAPGRSTWPPCAIRELTTFLELAAPHGGVRYLIARRRPRGRPVLAIEPHHD